MLAMMGSDEGRKLYIPGRERYRNEERRLKDELLAAISSDAGPEAIVQAANDYALYLSSEERLPGLLNILRALSAPVFWPVLQSMWSSCDDTWAHRHALLALMRRHADQAPPLASGAERWTVYRGCSRRRVSGIAWTLDRQVAEGFARGHRGMSVPAPVVATARIHRSGVFMFLDDREEREVVLNPKWLTKIEVSPAVAPAAT